MLYENFTGNAQIEKDLNKVCSKMDSVWWNGDKQSCLLRVENKAKYYLERDVSANMEIVEKHEDHTTVRMMYHNEIELFSFVKQWIPHVKIIDNQVLSDKLSEQLKSFLSENLTNIKISTF
jgi:predicted DNA-binding transcriptional regulator YafY